MTAHAGDQRGGTGKLTDRLTLFTFYFPFLISLENQLTLRMQRFFLGYFKLSLAAVNVPSEVMEKGVFQPAWKMPGWMDMVA